jgi:hypothetical protein
MDLYYDSVNMREPKMGSVTAGVFTPSDTTSYMGVTIDEDTRVTTNFAGSSAKGIRFTADVSTGVFVEDITDLVGTITDYVEDLGTAGIGTSTHLLINLLSGTPNVEVWASDSRTSGYVKYFDSSIENNTWSINALDSTVSKSYYVVQFTGTYDIDVGEIVLARKISDLYRYGLGWSESLVPFVTNKGSWDGGEFSNKKSASKVDKSFDWRFMDQSYLDKLKSLRSGIYGSAKSILMVEGSDRTFGKLQGDIIPKEVAYGNYSVNLSVRAIV